jgi:protein-disulfide isomerase
VRGNPKAAVTLEEYGDFECPPCGKLAGPLVEIEHEFGDRLRIIFHNFPLTTHQHARDAACAAEAAGRQDRFWEMHDLLYKEQAVWSKVNDVRALFTNYAGMLGLDRAQFMKDIESEPVKARVAADEERGKSLGVTNTPTLFVNDTMVPPTALNPKDLRATINAAARNETHKEKPL